MITDPDYMTPYNGVGLIGGELFDPEYYSPQFRDLGKDLNRLFLEYEIEDLWLTAGLLDESQEQQLLNFLKLFDFEKFGDNQRVLICTSYDTEGRFRDENHKREWFVRLEKLKKTSDHVDIHIQSTTFQPFIDEVMVGGYGYSEIVKNKYSFDFKPPAPGNHYRQFFNSVESYLRVWREAVFTGEVDSSVMPGSRSQYIQFLRKIAKDFGLEKVMNFAASEVRSKSLDTPGEVIEDRWSNAGDKDQAPCGHQLDSYCYQDSDKCCRCDALSLVEVLQNG